MAKKTKFFRVAVEGATSDGREISRDWLQQMGSNYNPEVYGARVSAEHILGMVPNGPFRAYGDVTATKAETIADGPFKGKLALYAQLDLNDAGVELIKSGQKIYPSMQVAPSFADTKQAYLIGLGITDTPASLGTEVLSFTQKHPEASPFTAADPVVIELEPDASANEAAAGFFKTLTDVLAKFSGKSTAQPESEAASTQAPAALPAPGVSAADILQGFTALDGALKAFNTANTAALAALRDEIKADRARNEAAITKINETLDSTPAHFNRRPAATGGNGTVVTDC